MARAEDSRTVESFHARHAGEACVIMANGPSLSREQCLLLKQAKPIVTTFGVNRSYEWLWPTYHVVQDNDWFAPPWLHVLETLDRESRLFVTSRNRPVGIGIHARQWDSISNGKKGFSLDLSEGVYVGATPYIALQLAAYMGFTDVAFVGLDMRTERADKTHFFGAALRAPSKEKFSKQSHEMAFADIVLTRMGIRVVNCSPDTALECFPYIELDDFLKGVAAERM